MAWVKSRQEAVHKRAQREDSIWRAIKAVQTMNKDGKPEMSLREASTAFGIPFSTLRGWLHGAQPHFVAHRAQQVLTPMDEKAVIRWIKALEGCGFPPKVVHVRQAAELIIKKEVGDHWITRFLNRHPEVAAKFTSPMERARIEAASPYIIRDHFMKLGRAIKSKNIQAAETYNMDEKGFLMGLAQASKVICSCEGGSKFKLPDDGNRELLTVIECVSGDGRVIPSFISYKGAHHYMGWHRFTDRDDISATFRFSYAAKGWTNRILGMEWLVEVFDKETRDQADSRWRYVISTTIIGTNI